MEITTRIFIRKLREGKPRRDRFNRDDEVTTDTSDRSAAQIAHVHAELNDLQSGDLIYTLAERPSGGVLRMYRRVKQAGLVLEQVTS